MAIQLPREIYAYQNDLVLSRTNTATTEGFNFGVYR